MKRSTLLLAMLSLSVVLYAQPAVSALTREQVLEVFSRFNPSVLEKARQDAAYQNLLEQLLASYDGVKASPNRWEMIALARNFDHSVYLHRLTETYRQLWLASEMMGADIGPQRELFTSDVRDVFTHFWAVTVQLRQYQLAQMRQELRQVRRDKTLPATERTQRQEQLKAQIQSLQEEIKAFKKQPGEQICFLTQTYVNQVEEKARAQAFAVKRQASMQAAQQAAQSENLQIKSKNKKPVAK